MIYLLVILILCLLSYLIYLHLMLKKLTKRLEYLNSIESNLVIDSATKNPFLLKLVKRINQLIEQNKKNYQTLVATQKQFDMAINNISHDIRTPLTVASGYTQILAKQVDGKQETLVKKISVNLADVEKKLEDLLTYNRLVEDRVIVNLEDFNVSSLLESKIVTYYDAFKKEHIDLEVFVEKDIRLISDRDIFNRMIDNALGNILNHGKDKGTVRLTQNEKEIQLSFSNETDQQISNYDKLFERFYTEDLSRVSKNSGLGLYIIQELSTMIRGNASVSGHEGYFELIITIQKNTSPLSV